MTDDELFREALEAHAGDPVIPDGFAEGVTSRVRVDRGGAFEVRAPHGTVRVTGTCFRVSAAADEGEATMTRAATAASAQATVEARGAGSDPGRAEGASAPRAELEREVARLRAILAATHLSPEGGGAAATQRRGIDSDGETDLTPDEWRQLAQRGELRFALPGTGGRDPDARVNHQAHEMGLRDHEVLGVREVFRRELERLLGELRGLYREAAGTEPGNLSLDALQSEIRDKTPGDTVAQVDWRLAQERGGLAEAPPAR